MRRTRIAILAAGVILGACTTTRIDPRLEAAAVCAGTAHDYGAVATVGAVATDLGGVRAFPQTLTSPRDEGAVTPILWPNLPANVPAVICYFDGSFPRSAPGGAGPASRAVVAVVNGTQRLIAVGPAAAIPLPQLSAAPVPQ